MSQKASELWDDGDSPTVIRIRAQQRFQGLDKWDNDQVTLVCRSFPCTVYELGAAAGMTRGQVKQCWNKNQWPMPVAMHFDRFRSFINWHRFGRCPNVGAEDAALGQLLERDGQ